MTDSNDTEVSPGLRETAAESQVGDDPHEEAYCSTCNQSFAIETLVCPDDGSRLVKLAARRDTLLGKVLDGRYEIRAPLGKGGMGTVYRGLQLSVDREVAIKVIHPKLWSDRASVKRFLREQKLAGKLSQPNIVNVYDAGNFEDELYIVMELLRGHTLASELGNSRRFDTKRTLRIGLQLCDALEAAHAQDIIHRDLKPGNIMILDDPAGRDLIKVLDFGLAKSIVADTSAVTNTDALLGTPLYMAPEQIEGKPTDQRTDLYALGCILYEMVSGAPPFVEPLVSAVLARHIGDAPAALPAHVPPRLAALIGRLLAKAPGERLQAAGDVRRVLEQVTDETVVRVEALHPIVPDAPDTMPDLHAALAETAAVTPPPVIVAVPPKPGQRWMVIAIIAIVPIAALLVFQFSSTSSTAPNTSGGGAGSGSSDHAKAAAPDAGGDAAMHVEVGSPHQPEIMIPAPVDAGVDAPIDAGAPRRHKPHDAKLHDPDVDFYPPTEKPKDKPKQKN